MWEEVSKASVFPSGVTGELWMTVLGVATSEEDVFGLLCRAAVAARQRGVTWADFLLSVLKLKSETVTDENYRLN